MENNRNLFLTIALSVGILLLWQVFYANPKIEAQRQAQIEQKAATAAATPASGDVPAPSVQSTGGDIPQSTAAPAASFVDRKEAVASGNRIEIETDRLKGSINLAGARFDDISLKSYHVTVDKDSPIVDLLSPAGGKKAYFVEFGYVGVDGAPGPTTEWTAPAGAILTNKTPITLTYDAPSGLTFKRTISVDDEYMFKITDAITNNSSKTVSLQNYGRSTRFFKPAIASTYILHEGMIGVTGEEGLVETKFSKMEKEGKVEPGKSTDGWLGITDKYWATALIPGGPGVGTPFQPRYQYLSDGKPRWQSDFLTDAISIAPGQTVDQKNQLFAGVKKTQIIDAYEKDQGIRQFELMIDWGWFHFITKPLFLYILDPLFHLFGNFGLAILATTVIVKALFFPLASMSYRSMARMKVMQPKMQEIKEKYPDDREKQQKATMELYKTEKINPVAGCWPMLIQIPVFFSLYKTLYVTIEMRHAPFFGWIHDLSAPDPTTIFNLFGLIPWDATAVLPHYMHLGVWPIIMGITMFVQMQMNPAPPDPTQQMIFKWMPVIFTFMLSTFPAGLVIYWAWNNTLSVLQQGYIMKKNGAEIALFDNLKSLFRIGKKQPTK